MYTLRFLPCHHEAYPNASYCRYLSLSLYLPVRIQVEGAWVDIAARLDGAASLVATWRAADDSCHAASERIAADCQVAEDAAAAEIARVQVVGEETRLALATMAQAILQSTADAAQVVHPFAVPDPLLPNVNCGCRLQQHYHHPLGRRQVVEG